MKSTTYIDKVLKEFEEIGFGNQARIVGVKRRELKDFIRDEIEKARKEERERVVDYLRERMGEPARIDEHTTDFVEGKIVILRQLIEELDSLKQK